MKERSRESAIEVSAQSADDDRATLRYRLANRLRQVIGNPVIEEKELAAFDIVMSRRDALKLGRNSLVVAGLVSAGVPPTAWARRDPSLGVHPCEVGLTDAEMASVTRAAQLAVGTELFQDTVYAQPLVSPAAVNTHALIEGARARPNLQSQLIAADSDEQNFLDKDYRWGPAELIQLEQDANGDWELVHYHHPWEPRTDGVKTDGLVRQVIMTKDDGLVSPTRVITVTGSSTNSVSYKGTNSSQVTGMSYVVFVEDTAAGDNAVGHLALGTGLANLPAPYNELSQYPVRWVSRLLDERFLGTSQGYEFADKYTSSGFDFPVAYDPVQCNEFIVLYFQDQIKVLFVYDSNTPGSMTVSVNSLEKPANAPDARVVHIYWNARQDFNGWIELRNVVLAASEKQSDGSIKYTTYSMDRHQGVEAIQSTFTAPNILRQLLNWRQAWNSGSFTVGAGATQNGELALDYSTVRDVHTLYKLSQVFQIFGATGVENYYVKLANFKGRGMVLFTILEVEKCYDDSTPCYGLAGHFPTSIPSSAVPGEILAFSGGASKFDGLRYVASDANGNVFLFRQRRYIGIDSPYAPPIYGNRDDTGQPITSLDPFAAGYLPLPPGTSGTSNLQQLKQWVKASNEAGGGANQNVYYNILLYAALAFATDESSSSQAVWLGNGYKAAYTRSRFAHDSEHVVIKQVQNGDDQIYSAFSVFKNPVDKTWRERQIASQMLITGPEQGESGDHYQATVTPVNAYGRPVSMLLDENVNLQIEVRADSPCTVIDDTNNYYYDIDRYTSFLATPDPGSGQLSVVTKATTFSQVLYVRLVDVSALSPSGDTALLGAPGDSETYAWQSENLALQAQQRMGNGGQVSSLLGDSLPIADTNVYVSGATLGDTNKNNPWDTKGSYQPTSDNLSGLASYLNTAGQNLISVTGQLSDPDPDTDPLYAMATVPSDPERNTVTTFFSYDTGTVATLVSSPSAMLSSPPGSIFSKISHALHDALHWLQNVEGDVYKDLSSGVSIVSAVDSITATVSKEIMKQVNGVEQDLQEVVNTVEEYASVVANLVVTIVESTFIYKFVELIIELISLFQHLKDIQSLAGSLRSRIDTILSGPDLLPADYSSWALFQSYFGSDSDLADQMDNLDVSSVVTEVTTGILDAISKNPMNKVLNKLLSSVASAIENEAPQPPISFTPNEAIFDAVSDDILALESDLITAFADLTGDVVGDAVTQMAADVANPQDTFKNLTAGLDTLVTQIEDDVLQPVLDWLDDVVRSGPKLLQEGIDQDPLITVDLTLLKDLLSLFGIGKKVNSTYTLSMADAVFFPMATVMWLALYTRTGKSIASVDDLDSATLRSPGPLTSSTSLTEWQIANLAVNFVASEVVAGIWALSASTKVKGDGGTPPNLGTFKDVGAVINLIRRFSGLFNFIEQNSGPDGQISGDVNYVELAFNFGQAGLALFQLVSRIAPSGGSVPSAGWPTSPSTADICSAVATFGTTCTIGYNVITTALSKPSTAEILSVTGQSLGRSQAIAAFFWDFIVPADEELLPVFLAYIASCPFGFTLQGAVASGELGGFGGGFGSCPRNKGKAKGKGNGKP